MVAVFMMAVLRGTPWGCPDSFPAMIAPSVPRIFPGASPDARHSRMLKQQSRLPIDECNDA